MQKWISDKLNQQQIQAISELVKAAEQNSRGELVPILIRSSHDYQFLAVVFSLVVFIAMIYLQPSFLLLFFHGYWQFAWLFIFIALYLVSQFLVRQSWFLRLVLPKSILSKHVEARAELEFYRRGLMKTNESTGVLLFISLLERKAIILADRGISEKLPKEYWQGILAQMIPDLRAGNLFSAYKTGIQSIGQELKAHFPKRGHDVNELSNHLIILE